MKASSVLTGFAAFYLGMVLLKDGTLPTLIQDFSRGAVDAAKGLRPITRVA